MQNQKNESKNEQNKSIEKQIEKEIPKEKQAVPEVKVNFKEESSVPFQVPQFTNPKSLMPQISLKRKVKIQKTLDLLQQINKSENLPRQLSMVDFVVMAIHQAVKETEEYSHFYSNGQLFKKNSLMISYKNLTNPKLNGVLEVGEIRSLSSYELAKDQIINDQYFLIEDGTESVLTDIQPVIQFDCVSQKECRNRIEYNNDRY